MPALVNGAYPRGKRRVRCQVRLVAQPCWRAGQGGKRSRQQLALAFRQENGAGGGAVFWARNTGGGRDSSCLVAWLPTMAPIHIFFSSIFP